MRRLTWWKVFVRKAPPTPEPPEPPPVPASLAAHDTREAERVKADIAVLKAELELVLLGGRATPGGSDR